MARREDTVKARLAIMSNPPSRLTLRRPKVSNGSRGISFDQLEESLLVQFDPQYPKDPEKVLARLSELNTIIYRNTRNLIIWAEFENQKLPKGAFDPDEYRDLRLSRLLDIRGHADSLRQLLKERYLPLSVQSVIKSKTIRFRDSTREYTERSLTEFLQELIQAIPPFELISSHQTKKPRKKKPSSIRQDGIRDLLNMWLALGNPPPKTQRKGADGPVVGSFVDFVNTFKTRVVGLQGICLESVVREAEKMAKKSV